jgi:hypothetical protein
MNSIRITAGLILGLAAAALPASAQFGVAGRPEPGAPTAPRATPRKPGTTAKLRLVHGILTGENVDVYVDGRRALADALQRGVTRYIDVPAGARTLTIRGAGAQRGAQPLASVRTRMAAGGTYTLAAFSRFGRPALFVANEGALPIGRGRTQVRFFHLSPDTRPVTITAAAVASTATGTTGPTRTIVGRLLPQTTRAVSIAPGNVTLFARVSGRTVAQSTVTLAPNTRYAVFAIGKPAGLDLLVRPVGQ